MKPSTQTVIKSLVWFAEREKVSLGVTRLVKLLYLADVEYCRRYGQRLTDLKWVFYYYGPYAFELETVLGRSLTETEQIPFVGGKVIKRLTPPPGGLEPDRLDYKAEGILKELFRRWGTVDLRDLLNYVYFETEPMLNARRGDRLDFTTVRPFTPPTEVRLNQSRLKEIRRKTREFLAARPIPELQVLTGQQVLADALKLWETDRPFPPIDFRCDVDLSKQQPDKPLTEDE